MDEEIVGAFSLTGRVAVVTGAGSGIGRDTVRVLAGAGAQVIATDVNTEGLAETIRAAKAPQGQVSARPLDVSDRQAVERLAQDLGTTCGRLDIWVNAAGILRATPILDATEADFDAMVAVNLKGVYWGCAAAARVMRENGGGSIVNIASAGADMPAPGVSVYAATKAAVMMVTRSAATEFGPLGIRVNSVAPGFVETPMVTYRYYDADGKLDEALRDRIRQERAAGVPLRTTGQPRDIALAILYLASDASRYVTGQVLRPNGGTVMP